MFSSQCLGGLWGVHWFLSFPVQFSHFTTQERHTFFFSLSLEMQKGLKREVPCRLWKAVGLQS